MQQILNCNLYNEQKLIIKLLNIHTCYFKKLNEKNRDTSMF